MGAFDFITDPFNDFIEATGDFASDAYDTTSDGFSSVVEDVADVGVIIGEGVVAAADTVGEGVVTFGEGAAQWSVAASGAVVDWSKTTASQISEWSESAAGTITEFSVATYEQAKPFVLTAVNTIRQGIEALANLFLKRSLPVLGPYDDRARHLLNYLLAGVVCPPVAIGAAIGNEIAPFPIPGPADALGELAKAMGATVGYELRITVGVTVTLGIYVDKTGGWGFYDGLGSTPLSIAASFSDPRNLGGEVKITTVFGGRDSFSGRSVYVLGGKVTMKGVTVGGDLILSASPLGFLGFDVRFGLSARMIGSGGDSEPSKPKYSLTTSDGAGAALAADLVAGKGPLAAVAGSTSDTAPSWDAATRAALSPGDEEAIRNTALAAAMSPFLPRYYGALTINDDGCVLQSIRNDSGVRTLVCTEPLIHASQLRFQSRSTWRLIRGLHGEADCVSIEADLDGVRGYIHADGSDTRLVDRVSALISTPDAASFRLVRGLSDPNGVSFQSRSDASKYLHRDDTNNALRLGAGDGSGVFKMNATFRIKHPHPLPARERAVLVRGEVLGGADRVRRSADGHFVLELRGNGSLVVRRGTNVDEWPSPELMWSSPGGPTGSYHAVLLDGCRIGVYHGAGPQDRGALLWSSDVHGQPGDTAFAAVTAAGCLAVFQGSVDRPGELVWSSRGGRVHWPRERRARVSLRTFDNHYLGGASDTLTATAIARGRDQLFEILTLWNGKVALRGGTGKYLCAEGGGGGVVTVSRDTIGPWEQFERVEHGQHIALRASSGHYLCAEGGGGSIVVANRSQVAEWERFRADIVADDYGFMRVDLGAGVALTSAPAVGSSTGRMLVTFRGTDRAQYILPQFGSTWQPLGHFAGSGLAGAPAATSGPEALQVIYHVSPNGKLYWAWNDQSNSEWHTWGSHAGTLRSPPGAASWGPGQRDVFAILANGNLGQTYYNGDGYVDWIDLGKPGGVTLDGAPAAVASSQSRLDVFIRDTDNGLWGRTRLMGSGWGSWYLLGNAASSAPTAACPAEGKIWLFVRGLDTSLHHLRFENGAWGSWQHLGGALGSAPAATSRERGGGCDVFARARDGGLLWTYWTGTRWTHLG